MTTPMSAERFADRFRFYRDQPQQQQGVQELFVATPSASKVDASPKRPFQPGGLMEFFQCVLTAKRSKRMSVDG